MSNKPSKSDPPSLKLDASLVQELARFGFDAFEDPEEITSVTANAAKAIIDDQKTNRRDAESTRSLLAILGVLVKMRKEQRAATQRVRQVLYTLAVIGATVFALDKLGFIKIVFH